MKEATDLVKALLAAMTEVTEIIETQDDFDGRAQLLVDIDSAYNDVSYSLSLLG